MALLKSDLIERVYIPKSPLNPTSQNRNHFFPRAPAQLRFKALLLAASQRLRRSRGRLTPDHLGQAGKL